MSTKITCNECDNVVCLIKQHCTSAWIKNIEPNKIQMEYKAGDYIFREGEKVFGMYFIQHGKVKVVSKNINNRDEVVCIATNGHILGHPGYGEEIYPVSARALCNITLCFLDNDSFYDICINNPQFTMGITIFYSRELRKAEARLKYITSRSDTN